MFLIYASQSLRRNEWESSCFKARFPKQNEALENRVGRVRLKSVLLSFWCLQSWTTPGLHCRSGKRREAQAINFHNLVPSFIILYNQTTYTSVLYTYLHVHSLVIFDLLSRNLATLQTKFAIELLYSRTRSILRNAYWELLFFKLICEVQDEDIKIENILFSTLPLI